MLIEEEMAAPVSLLQFEIKSSVYKTITSMYRFLLWQKKQGRTCHCLGLFGKGTKMFPYKLRMAPALSEDNESI